MFDRASRKCRFLNVQWDGTIIVDKSVTGRDQAWHSHKQMVSLLVRRRIQYRHIGAVADTAMQRAVVAEKKVAEVERYRAQMEARQKKGKPIARKQKNKKKSNKKTSKK